MAITIDENPFPKALQEWKDQLREKDKKGRFYEMVVNSQEAASNLSSTEEAEKYARDLMERLAEHAKSSKFSRICSKIQPLVGSLKRLMTVCGSISQSASMGAGGVVFSGVGFLLELANEQEDTFSKMGDLMHDIDVRLFCNASNWASFKKSKKMRQLFVEDYKTIISIFHRASIVLSRPSIRILGSNVARSIPEEFDEYLKMLEKNGKDMKMIAEALANKDKRNGGIAKWIMGGQENHKLNFWSDRNKNKKEHQEGTCSWILDDEKFKRWYGKDSMLNQVVWYNAPPGSGKTFLSAMVARHIEELEGRYVAYYRFDYNDNERNSILGALRSIALRLLEIGIAIHDDTPDQVQELYREEVNRHSERLSDPETAIKVITAFLDYIPRVHIVVDGLDECQGKDDEYLGPFSELLCYSATGITKWFITSRREPPIRIFMQNAKVIEICPSKKQIEQDITTYLEARRNEMKIQKCEECVARITAKSDGNFLYSALMFRILCDDSGMCDEEIHEELSSFPDGLGDLYKRCIAKINERQAPHRDFARRIFVFMACAAQPLTVNQLLHALAVRLDADHDDFQPGRVSEFKRVQDLCGSLIEVEGTGEAGDDGGRIVKFVHKSVLDYLTNNPADLGIEDRELHRFFVDVRGGNVELGRHCLKYLSYRRYQGRVADMGTILGSDGGEHAFLKYSAAFWFLHLGEGEPSPELFSEVRSFLRSPAFWTCLAVQAMAHPNLFSTYTSVGSGFEVGRRDGPAGEKNIADPLPRWLPGCEPDGHRYTKALQEYIAEWHGMLKHSDEPWGHCMMDQEGRELFAGLKSMRCKDVRHWKIVPPEEESPVALTDVVFDERSGLRARIAYPSGDTVGWSEICTNTPDTPKHHVIRNLDSELDFGDRVIRFSYSSRHDTTEGQSAWSINLHNMSIKYDGQEVFAGLSTNGKDQGARWGMVTESVSTIDNRTAYGIHFTCSNTGESLKRETDSGYGGSLSSGGSDHSNDSDDEWNWDSDSGNDSDDSDEQQPDHSDAESRPEYNGNIPTSHSTDCLVFLCEGRNPIVDSWVGGPDRSQTSCAFHPSRNIAVWSRSPSELRVLDMTTAKVSTRKIVEPAGFNEAASVVVRDLHFSSCGRYIDCLLVTYADDAGSRSLCSVFLSTYAYSDEDKAPLPSTCAVRSLAYKPSEPTDALREPYLLSHWGQDHLYLCLPDFSLCPRIARLGLGYPQPAAGAPAADATGPAAARVQTLAKALFFPSSTARRGPRMLYRRSRSRSRSRRHGSGARERGELALALGPLRLSDSSGLSSQAPPVVVMWRIEEGLWRAWDPERDGEPTKVWPGARAYYDMRGTFLDRSRRFQVIVRPRLDYTKEFFLTCL